MAELTVQDIKNPILFIFDESFEEDRGLEVVMNVVYDVISHNRDGCFVYGMKDRYDWHVENYANIFGVPSERLVHFTYDSKDRYTISRKYATLLKYCPSKLYIFRDNVKSGYTSDLVNKCIEAGIPVTSYNSDWQIETITQTSRMNKGTKYFKEFY